MSEAQNATKEVATKKKLGVPVKMDLEALSGSRVLKISQHVIQDYLYLKYFTLAQLY
jgi:hypothetical protein